MYPLSSRFAKSPGQSPSLSPSQLVSKSPSFSFVQLEFWFGPNLIHIQRVGLSIFYLPSSWTNVLLLFDCCSFFVCFDVAVRSRSLTFYYFSCSLKWLSTGASFVVATSYFKYMGYNTLFHFMIDVLNLKLCFATDVLTESQVRYPSLVPFFLMEFLYFTG